jgi:hypothetical protein
MNANLSMPSMPSKAEFDRARAAAHFDGPPYFQRDPTGVLRAFPLILERKAACRHATLRGIER